MTVEIHEMQNVAVRISAATAHCAVGVTLISGRAHVTEKAIGIVLDTTGETVYFPKKALVKRYEDTSAFGKTVFCQIAHWFNPDAAAWRKINKGSHSGFIAA